MRNAINKMRRNALSEDIYELMEVGMYTRKYIFSCMDGEYMVDQTMHVPASFPASHHWLHL